jgi:hypothetical protein
MEWQMKISGCSVFIGCCVACDLHATQHTMHTLTVTRHKAPNAHTTNWNFHLPRHNIFNEFFWTDILKNL